MKKPLILIFLILIIDQAIKIYVKTHFYLGEEILVGNLPWFRIHFLENKGMAFGMSFGDTAGKIVLTTVRIVASVLVFLYLKHLVRKNESKLMIYSFTLIFAGAVGNIIDSLFYGVLFSQSTFFQVAAFMPQDGGYAPMFLGKVVDMFYFPLIDTVLPDWIPFVGGKNFSFFDAIFNFSDAAITVGVIVLVVALIFNQKKESESSKEISEA